MPADGSHEGVSVRLIELGEGDFKVDTNSFAGTGGEPKRGATERHTEGAGES